MVTPITFKEIKEMVLTEDCFGNTKKAPYYLENFHMIRDEELDSACLFPWHVFFQSSELCTSLACISCPAFPHFHLAFADLVYHTAVSFPGKYLKG